jgi:hypothetical protein
VTWIVGAPTIFGYGFGISDVRVTLGDGTERDCLQKVHQVGQFIAGGFAGSVRIGFAMLETLAALLHTDNKESAWDPKAVAEWWPQDARDIFVQFPEEERQGQCHLMLVSTHPTENCGDGSAPARSYIHVFKSPDFQPVETIGRKLLHIGCGEYVKPCSDAVETLSNDHQFFSMMMQGEVNNSGGMVSMVGHHLTDILKRTQPHGISSHLHYCWVYRGNVIIKTNDHSTRGRWTAIPSGSGINREEGHEVSASSLAEPGGVLFQMPRLASSWEELESLLGTEGRTAVGSIA